MLAEMSHPRSKTGLKLLVELVGSMIAVLMLK